MFGLMTISANATVMSAGSVTLVHQVSYPPTQISVSFGNDERISKAIIL